MLSYLSFFQNANNYHRITDDIISAIPWQMSLYGTSTAITNNYTRSILRSKINSIEQNET